MNRLHKGRWYNPQNLDHGMYENVQNIRQNYKKGIFWLYISDNSNSFFIVTYQTHLYNLWNIVFVYLDCLLRLHAPIMNIAFLVSVSDSWCPIFCLILWATKNANYWAYHLSCDLLTLVSKCAHFYLYLDLVSLWRWIYWGFQLFRHCRIFCLLFIFIITRSIQ